jgi:hypothetical protein
MLCLRRPTIYMLWSVCRDASCSRHLTASCDSFAGTSSVVPFRVACWIVPSRADDEPSED